jgi:hypothetical protein
MITQHLSDLGGQPFPGESFWMELAQSSGAPS